MVMPVNTLRASINAKCEQCIKNYDCEKGTWQENVHMCPRIRCPLYRVRPRLPVKASSRHIQWLLEEPGHPFWTTKEGWELAARLKKKESSESS